jgi:Dienelactone hydrolase and related enzymes
MGHIASLQASDGHKLDAYVAEPAGKPRGLLVVIQEIFGVNSHIRSVADGYAADGYLAIAPAMFDRVQRNYEAGYAPEDIEAGRAIMGQLDWNNAVRDVQAALEHGKHAGKAGVVGYCWGGVVAWLAATRIDGFDAAISYYGGSLPNFVDEQPRCPVMLHFGLEDKSPTAEQAKAFAARHPQAIAHYYPAGHGFNCDQRGSYHAESAALARQRTLEFLAKHVG